jgi:transposase
MDAREKVVNAVKTGTPRNKATSLSGVRGKHPYKLSDDIRDQVLKAVESGMSCRQAAAHCGGVSLASAIRFAKRTGLTDKRAQAKQNVRDEMLKAIEGGMSCEQAAAHYGLSPTTAVKWAKKAGVQLKHRPPNKFSDDIRDQVLKAVESGMSRRQAAAHCAVSLASAIRWTKHLRT